MQRALKKYSKNSIKIKHTWCRRWTNLSWVCVGRARAGIFLTIPLILARHGIANWHRHFVAHFLIGNVWYLNFDCFAWKVHLLPLASRIGYGDGFVNDINNGFSNVHLVRFAPFAIYRNALSFWLGFISLLNCFGLIVDSFGDNTTCPLTLIPLVRKTLLHSLLFTTFSFESRVGVLIGLNAVWNRYIVAMPGHPSPITIGISVALPIPVIKAVLVRGFGFGFGATILFYHSTAFF